MTSDRKIKIVDLNTVVSKNIFVIIVYCLLCIPSNSPKPLQMKSGITFIRGKGCINIKSMSKMVATLKSFA